MSTTTTITPAEAARAEVLASLKAGRADYAEALERRRGVLVDAGWVTRFAGGFYNRITLDANKTITAIKACGVLHATHMTERDARTVAAVTKNGAGQACEAVPYVQALRDELAAIEKLIGDIEARAVGPKVAA